MMENKKTFISRTDEEIRAGLMASMERHRRQMARLSNYAEQYEAKRAVAV